MMINHSSIQTLRESIHSYLVDRLLPFWLKNAPDSQGGFLTYFDRNGKPTGETTKTFLMQIRNLYTMSSAHRAGYGNGQCAELAKQGADFILEHYWDANYGGWYWIADRQGNPIVKDKIGYGQCFGMYAFSEYYLATGDIRGKIAAENTYTAISNNMIDTRYGGFYEIMTENWQPHPGERSGGNRKSMDVHMHMMEALTNMFEMSHSETHRRRLIESINLIGDKMLDPVSGTGGIQYTWDYTPLPAIIFDVKWGRDADPEDNVSRPLNYTSYGHNVEFAWLLLHAGNILGTPKESYADVAKKILDHCLQYGIDWEVGGVFVEGSRQGHPSITEKQFWQQAEVLVGLLDGYYLFGEQKYWDAFTNVYQFVHDKFIHWEAGGEWYERVDRAGNPIDSALGHAWKINYHTVRSMIQVIKRLDRILSQDNFS